MGCSETLDAENVTGAPEPAPITMLIEPCGNATIVTLWAGQFIDAGSVTVSNDADLLSIEITAASGWLLAETHAAVARSLEYLPQTGSGNPQVGHFDLAEEHDPPVSSFTYEISLAEYEYLPGDDLVLAVHAVVQQFDGGSVPIQEETAWADGLEFPGSSWATYFEYVVQVCTVLPDCELIVTHPSGGELCLFEEEVITWEYSGEACGSTVRIELLHNGVPCGMPLAESAPNSGSFVWFVEPCGEGGDLINYAIRVTDLESEAADESDEPFGMIPCGGGE
jgi:hypothetical protein